MSKCRMMTLLLLLLLLVMLLLLLLLLRSVGSTVLLSLRAKPPLTLSHSRSLSSHNACREREGCDTFITAVEAHWPAGKLWEHLWVKGNQMGSRKNEYIKWNEIKIIIIVIYINWPMYFVVLFAIYGSPERQAKTFFWGDPVFFFLFFFF